MPDDVRAGESGPGPPAWPAAFRLRVGAATGLPPERLCSLRLNELRRHAEGDAPRGPPYRVLALGMPVGDISPDEAHGRPLFKGRYAPGPDGVYSAVFAWARVDWLPDAPAEPASDDLPYVEGVWTRHHPATGPAPVADDAPDAPAQGFIDVRNAHLLTTEEQWRLARAAVDLLRWLPKHPGAPGLDVQQPGWIKRTLDCEAFKDKHPSLTWEQVAARFGLSIDQLNRWRRRLRARGYARG